MYITREKAIKSGGIAVILLICIAIVGLILNGISQFKLSSQLAGINQVSNLSHLLVRQQAKLFSLMLVKKAKNEELIEALDTFAKEDFVIDANLYSVNGNLIAQSANAQPFDPKHYATYQNQSTQQIVEPIYAQHDLVGFLRVTFDMQYGQTTQNKVNQLFHLLYGELMILFLAGGLFMSCFYAFRRKTHLVVNSPLKVATTENRPPSQRFHSRRRAFRRK